MSWIASHFLNSAFVLPGLALASVPIIIHLLNRLRYKKVRFAAMEFLLQSQQRNKRRLMMEQLLLLLLRVLIVLGIVALIARMVLDPTQLSLFRGTQSHHLVLLDDSASMQQRWGETTAFDEGLEIVRRLASEGAKRPDTQKFTLIRLSRPREALFTERDVNEGLVTELDTKLENVRCSNQSPGLIDGLEAVREFFAEDAATIKQLHIITDFRDHDWLGQNAVADILTQLDDADIKVNIVRTVPRKQDNLAIVDLSSDIQVASAGVPMRFNVSVVNHGDSAATDVRLTVTSDGQRLPLSVVFESIEPAAVVSQTQDLVFDTPGQHRVRVSLDADSMAADNDRYLAFEIVAANPVLIIDGQPDGDEGRFIADALAADPRLTGFAPVVDRVDYLRTQVLDRFRCIYLINVPELPIDALEPVRQFVENGGGLVWYVGDQTLASFYNQKLFAGGQDGLFPIPLANTRSELFRDDNTNPGPDLLVTDHPVFGILSGQDNPFVETVRITNYRAPAKMFIDADENEQAWVNDDNRRTDGITTIARLRNKSPLVLEHRYKGTGGRIVTFLTTAGPQWNSWALNPSYVITQLELQKYISRVDQTTGIQLVGQPIELSLPVADYLENVQITMPESAGEGVARLNAAPKSDAGSTANLYATFRDTDSPGVYRIRLNRADSVPEDRWIAYNVSTHESQLDLADDNVLREALGEAEIEIQEPGEFSWIQGRDAGHEVRMTLLILLLIALALEQFMAYRLSYHSRGSSRPVGGGASAAVPA
jgi:hypothetical protein